MRANHEAVAERMNPRTVEKGGKVRTEDDHKSAG